jgi:hypothetical protein
MPCMRSNADLNGGLMPRMIGVLVNINSAFALGSYCTIVCGRMQTHMAWGFVLYQ